jgi:hypothetical protein
MSTTTHLSEWPKSKTLTMPKADKGVKQQEFSFIVDGNAKLIQPLWKAFGSFLFIYLIKLDILNHVVQ